MRTTGVQRFDPSPYEDTLFHRIICSQPLFFPVGLFAYRIIYTASKREPRNASYMSVMCVYEWWLIMIIHCRISYKLSSTMSWNDTFFWTQFNSKIESVSTHVHWTNIWGCTPWILVAHRICYRMVDSNFWFIFGWKVDTSEIAQNSGSFFKHLWAISDASVLVSKSTLAWSKNWGTGALRLSRGPATWCGRRWGVEKSGSQWRSGDFETRNSLAVDHWGCPMT